MTGITRRVSTLTTLIMLLLMATPGFAACVKEAKAIKLQVDNWTGHSLELKTQYDRTLALLQQEKNCPLALAQLSRIVRKAGYLKGHQYRPENRAKSRQLAEQAVALDPTCYLCQWELAHVELYDGNARGFEATLPQLKQTEKTPLDRIYTQAVEANFQLLVKKDHARAGAIADAITGDDERFIHLYKLDIQKDVYKHMGKLDRVDALFQEELKLKPTAWVHGDYAAFLTRHLKQHDRAIVYARKSLALMDYPLGHVKLSNALSNKAYDMIKAGDLQGSIPLNEEAYKENSSNTHASNNLGYVYRELALNHSNSWEQHLANKNKAVEWYNKTLETDAKNDYAKRELGGIRLWKGKG